MNRRLRAALTVCAALTAGVLVTACENGGTDASDAPATTATATATGATGSGASSPAAGTSGDTAGKSGSGTGTDSGSDSSAGDTATAEAAAGSGSGSGVGQSCGTNDLSWSAKPMTQAGGYYQISVKAKSGITCVLPGGLPVIAFGSGGTEAGPAEQVAGEEMTLSGAKTAYAGVNPNSTNSDTGVEYTTVIVSVSQDDPNPISLKVPNVVVDKPIVTNWHTDPADAVPFTS
ncbi:DUF4232 domain-containing protein [Streptomyces fumanus]|uniref:DUF4232 domain-containing protein n=1 Tax=Streptomyces fumanus TaxID=67302 RepID=A0A919B115_9ACTN|nr:DUF4232 domain-containing protein [Streptomyces fumanus]GHF34273.1 hypothetical protein GCM10018772_69900 [Streptomyces fumanus]